jgi:hypothetical protein
MPFPTRPDKTFLVEAGAHRFRLDLQRGASGYAVARILQHEAKPAAAEETDLPALFVEEGEPETSWVGELLARRPCPAAEVTVLSTRLAALVVEMPGLGSDGWEGALEMEAQSFTGWSGSEAQLAYARLPADEGIVKVWIVQGRLRELIALRGAVAAARGARLAAVGHPGGIRLERGVAQLELWPNFALHYGADNRRLELRGWSGPDAATDAGADPEVAADLASGRLRLLRADASTLVEGGGGGLLDFSNPEAVAFWAGRLAEACDPLSGRPLALPLISIPRPPVSAKTLVFSALGAGLAALLLVLAHYSLSKSIERRDTEELARLKAPAEKLAEDKSQIADLKKRIAELDKQFAEAGTKDSGPVDPFSHRIRLGRLLSGIAAATHPETVVLAIRPDSLSTRLEGIASTPTGAQSLATRLDESLAAGGWRAALVRRTAKLRQSDGGPWSFEIRLLPERPVDAKTTAAAKPAAASAATTAPPPPPLPLSINF